MGQLLCRLMGLALGPQMPPLDVKRVMNVMANLWPTHVGGCRASKNVDVTVTEVT